jgi:predicted NBD/HSP70 family sugar kinase
MENNWDKDFFGIMTVVEELSQGKDIEGMAIGIAGALGKEQTGLLNSVNLSSWEGINIKDAFAGKFNCRVDIGNDTFMAGFGEGHYGKIKKDFLYINWGTGVGGCLVNFCQDKKLSTGKKEGLKYLIDIRATELGHQMIPGTGIKCRCGQKDCLDAYVGGRGIEKLYQKSPENLTQKEWKEVVGRMAIGIINAVVVYPVEFVVMGGGIALNQFEKIKHLEEIINKKIKIIPPPKLQLASLNDYSGLYGGLAYIISCKS